MKTASPMRIGLIIAAALLVISSISAQEESEREGEPPSTESRKASLENERGALEQRLAKIEDELQEIERQLSAERIDKALESGGLAYDSYSGNLFSAPDPETKIGEISDGVLILSAEGGRWFKAVTKDRREGYVLILDFMVEELEIQVALLTLEGQQRAARRAAEREARKRERCQAARNRWEGRAAQLVCDGRVVIGMTGAQVEASWGRPEDINRTTRATGTEEQWVYGSGRYVYFDNGIVTVIQD